MDAHKELEQSFSQRLPPKAPAKDTSALRHCVRPMVIVVLEKALCLSEMVGSVPCEKAAAGRSSSQMGCMNCSGLYQTCDGILRHSGESIQSGICKECPKILPMKPSCDRKRL